MLSARDPRALRLLAPSDAAAELGLGQCALSFRHAAARETLFPSGAPPPPPPPSLLLPLPMSLLYTPSLC